MPPRVALVSAILLAACTEESEEVRLQKRLDSMEVSLYRTGRDAIAQGAADPRAGQSRDAVAKLFQTAPDGGASDAMANARGVLDALKASPPAPTGQPAPLLRGVIGLVQPGATLDPRFGPDEERVVLAAVLWVLHAHPDAPHVPAADSFALYESMSIGPAALESSPLRKPARALRTLALGQARLCHTAERENAALRAGAADDGLADGVAMLGVAGATPAQVRALGLSLRALAAAQVAECFVDRREPERAATALSQLCEDARALGLDARELGDVCQGKPDTAAIARATRSVLLHRTGLEDRLKALPVVEAARRFVTGAIRPGAQP